MKVQILPTKYPSASLTFKRNEPHGTKKVIAGFFSVVGVIAVQTGGKHRRTSDFEPFYATIATCRYKPNSCSRYCFIEPICCSWD